MIHVKVVVSWHIYVRLIGVMTELDKEAPDRKCDVTHPQVAKATMALVSVASLGAYILAPSVVRAVTPVPTLTPTDSPATPRAKTGPQTENV